MFGINPYALLAGGVATLAIIGGFAYQSHEIHKYHTEYNCVSTDADCPKNYSFDTVPNLRAKIIDMTQAQKAQTKTVDRVVTRVIQAPAQVVTKTIVKEIHDTPKPVDCHKSPEFPQDVKDSY